MDAVSHFRTMMTNNARKTKLWQTTLTKVVVGFFMLAVVPLSALSQDGLLLNPQGEIIFGEEAPPRIEPAKPDPAYSERLSAAEQRKQENEAALRRLNDAMIVSSERQKELASGVAALDQDRSKLVDQLIATARSIQSLEDSLTETERTLLNLADEEKRIRKSLAGRRAILAEVLAALQRMGKNPPPALFVSVNDALESVRSAILLGSVLPELRAEAKALLADLDALKKVANETRAEQNQLVEQERQLSEEQVRLDLLIKENQKLKEASGDKLLSERENADVLASNATNLRDLIKDISDEISTVIEDVAAAEEKAKQDAADLLAAFEAKRERERADIINLKPVETLKPSPGKSDPGQSVVIAFRDSTEAEEPRVDTETTILDYSNLLKDSDQTKPAIPFVETKGLLPFPARGVELTSFGGADGLGGVSQGITIETRAQAPVISPANGRVVFAGKFSGFEQLLIMDVGDGYHIVLAGMDSINVNVGDLVAAGEPVALMGGKRFARLAGLSTDAASSLQKDFSGSQMQPVLYVEFRKDGKSINSTPWWGNS